MHLQEGNRIWPLDFSLINWLVSSFLIVTLLARISKKQFLSRTLKNEVPCSLLRFKRNYIDWIITTLTQIRSI